MQLNVSVGMIGGVYFLKHYYNYALGPFVAGPLMYSLYSLRFRHVASQMVVYLRVGIVEWSLYWFW